MTEDDFWGCDCESCVRQQRMSNLNKETQILRMERERQNSIDKLMKYLKTHKAENLSKKE